MTKQTDLEHSSFWKASFGFDKYRERNLTEIRIGTWIFNHDWGVGLGTKKTNTVKPICASDKLYKLLKLHLVPFIYVESFNGNVLNNNYLGKLWKVMYKKITMAHRVYHMQWNRH